MQGMQGGVGGSGDQVPATPQETRSGPKIIKLLEAHETSLTEGSHSFGHCSVCSVIMENP